MNSADFHIRPFYWVLREPARDRPVTLLLVFLLLFLAGLGLADVFLD